MYICLWNRIVGNTELSAFLLHWLQIHTLSYEELQQRITELDPEMEREIEELRKRYQAKRQPIIDAIDAKKRRLQKY